MRIGLVGGIERARNHLVEAAHEAGHELEVHDGAVGGRGAGGLAGLVERVDVVLISVGINSHGGALIAKDLARKRGREVVILRKPTLSALLRAIRQLPTGARPRALAAG